MTMYKPRYLFEDAGDLEFDKSVMEPINQAIKALKEVSRQSKKMIESTQGDLYKHINTLRDQADYLLKKALTNLEVLLESQGNDHLFNRINNVREALVGARSSKLTGGKGDVHTGVSVRSLLIEVVDSVKSWPEKTSLQKLRKEGTIDSIKIAYENRCNQYNQILSDMHKLFPSLKVHKYEIPSNLIFSIFN